MEIIVYEGKVNEIMYDNVLNRQNNLYDYFGRALASAG